MKLSAEMLDTVFSLTTASDAKVKLVSLSLVTRQVPENAVNSDVDGSSAIGDEVGVECSVEGSCQVAAGVASNTDTGRTRVSSSDNCSSNVEQVAVTSCLSGSSCGVGRNRWWCRAVLEAAEVSTESVRVVDENVIARTTSDSVCASSTGNAVSTSTGTMVSAPVPPLTVSAPSPPLMVSIPVEPVMLSAPRSPERNTPVPVTARAVPAASASTAAALRVSLPAPP